MAFSLTVTLDVAGRHTVVIGGGDEAVDRVDSLLAGDAEVVLITPAPAPELREHACAGRVTWHERGYATGDLAGAFVGYVTREDETDVAAAWAESRDERVLLSTLDDKPRCDFATPAVVRRGDLVVTIATAGRAPALSKRLRRRHQELIGPEHGELVDVLEQARARCVPRPVSFAEWAARWEAALADLDGLAALVREGRDEEARERVVATVRGQEPVVATPSGRA